MAAPGSLAADARPASRRAASAGLPACAPPTVCAAQRRAALQGLPALRVGAAEVAGLLAAVGDAAARGSAVAGELPAPSRDAAADLLAAAGLLGRVLSLQEVRARRAAQQAV